ncbi:MAG TPA: EAL domain-containing protein [Candidatus Binatia bacterium]|nr:EAL domain-containing protein [Candidatus Binatia bacterium]
MSKPLRVLIVDDSEDDALLVLRALRNGAFEPVFERVDTPEALSAALTRQRWDIVIADYSMPRFNGLSALSIVRQSALDIPFILVSGTIGEDVAVEAMKAGAQDYVMKGNTQRLVSAIERELREVEIRRERKRAESWLRYLAQYDPLTDLPNRNLLHERLDEALVKARRENQPVALLLMDLDHFKEINDTMGHQTGDLLLQEVGRRLQGALRRTATVARLGGDEFAVSLPGMDEQGAVLTARELLKILESSFLIGEIAFDARASIGIAIYPQHGDDKEGLMRHADIAMYAAKRSASGYTVYSPDLDCYSPQRLARMAGLHRAIDNKQLSLAYQPKIDLGTATVVGVEALARWRHSEFGLISPEEFIPMAERTGFIKPLTIWALNSALGQARCWQEKGLNISVSVNLSPRLLHDINFPDRVVEVLETHGLAPEQLELEITENTIMADPACSLEILTRLSRLGVALSIDDFGTGYSSLAYLKKLPVVAVKIDKSFVINMSTDSNDALIVRSTIDLAHNLGLKVIAEGVETREVWDRLVALGCDQAQGYYMSRPLPSGEMTQWLLESPWRTPRANAQEKPLEVVIQSLFCAKPFRWLKDFQRH